MIKIVVSAKACKCEKFAAKELSDFIYRASGIAAEIITEGTEDLLFDTDYIFVGDTVVSEKFSPLCTEDKLNRYGFIIRQTKNITVIRGAADRGTLYGVYDFLEKQLGIKFVAEDCTYIPKTEHYKVKPIEVTAVPDFPIHTYMVLQVHNPLFAARTRMITPYTKEVEEYGYGIERDFIDGIHNTFDFVPPDQYYAEHPEFYYSVDGTPREICWSNGLTPDGDVDQDLEVSVPKILIHNLKKKILAHPKARYFMIGQQDNMYDVCRCEKCLANEKKYGAYSANLIIFLKAIIKEIKKWAHEELNDRKIKLVMFAYNYSEKPPVVKDKNGKFSAADEKLKCHGDIVVRIATSEADFSRSISSELNQRADLYHAGMTYRQVFDGWRAITDEFFVWDYNLNFYETLWYSPTYRNLQENFRFYKEYDVTFLMCQAEHCDYSSFQAKLKYYISKELMWNVNADVTKLTSEFFELYFGAASKTAENFFNAFEDRLSYLLDNTDYAMYMYLYDWAKFFAPKYFPTDFLEDRIAEIDRELERINKMDFIDKEQIVRRLYSMKIVPERMLAFNYDKIYRNGSKVEFIKKLIADMKMAGCKDFSNGGGKVNVLEKTGQEYGGDIYSVAEYFNIS